VKVDFTNRKCHKFHICW